MPNFMRLSKEVMCKNLLEYRNSHVAIPNY